MRSDIRPRHDAHVRVSGVCTEHSAVFDAAPGCQQTRTALGTCIADVERLLAVQAQSNEDRRASTEESRLARRALRDATKAVVTVGRLVHLDDLTTATMQLPRQASDDELIADARGIANRVAAHADGFIAIGLPADVLSHVERAIQELAAARDAGAAVSNSPPRRRRSASGRARPPAPSRRSRR